jgi:anti-anti-sigma factor
MLDQSSTSVIDAETFHGDVVVSDRAAVITIVGELDIFTASKLEHLIGAAELAGALDVTVNARGVTFIDCRGFRVLMAHARALAPQGGRLRVDQPSPQVVRVLALMERLGANRSVEWTGS